MSAAPTARSLSTITLDSATGDVTFTEDRAIQNNNTGSTGVSLAADVVTLTQTIIDHDGTTASANIDLGAKLAITDDEPTITASSILPTQQTVSESGLPGGTTPGQASTSVVGHFGGDFTDNFGADGALGNNAQTAKSYSLVLQSTATNLIDTASGKSVTLVLNQATGEIDGTVTLNDGSTATVFTITVDASTGDVTFTDERAVHNNGTTASLLSGSVYLEQTITDGDGTVVSTSGTQGLDISRAFGITDDTPIITTAAAPTLSVSESNLTFLTNGVNGTDPDFKLTSAMGDFSKAFIDAPGADGLKSTAYALSIVGGNGTNSG